jgi:hypothetical protein
LWIRPNCVDVEPAAVPADADLDLAKAALERGGAARDPADPYVAVGAA